MKEEKSDYFGKEKWVVREGKAGAKDLQTGHHIDRDV